MRRRSESESPGVEKIAHLQTRTQSSRLMTVPKSSSQARRQAEKTYSNRRFVLPSGAHLQRHADRLRVAGERGKRRAMRTTLKAYDRGLWHTHPASHLRLGEPGFQTGSNQRPDQLRRQASRGGIKLSRRFAPGCACGQNEIANPFLISLHGASDAFILLSAFRGTGVWVDPTIVLLAPYHARARRIRSFISHRFAQYSIGPRP